MTLAEWLWVYVGVAMTINLVVRVWLDLRR